MDVYTKVQTEEVVRVTGRKPIGVRWVDVNKQGEADPKYRYRFMVKEITKHPKPELYAATPPSECLRMVVSSSVRKAACRSDSTSPMKIMVCDVSRAYFYVLAVWLVYTQLADEDRGPEDHGLCGRFDVSMYGHKRRSPQLAPAL